MTDFKNLTKDDIQYITRNISPAEVQYVTGVSTLLHDVGNEYKSRFEDETCCDNDEQCCDKQSCDEVCANVLLINKLLSYNTKLVDTTYAVKSETYKARITDFQWCLKDCIDNCIMILRSNPYYDNQDLIYNLQLPVESEPMALICSLKDTVFDYLSCADIKKDKTIDLAEDRVLRGLMDELLRRICKAIYDFRLCRSAEYERDDVKPENRPTTVKIGDYM